MKMRDIVNAAPALQRLVGQELPLKAAYGLSHMIDRVNPHLEFYGREYLKAAQAKDDQAALAQLLDFNCDFDVGVRVDIPLSAPLTLSPAEVKFLAPFVAFIEEDDDGA